MPTTPEGSPIRRPRVTRDRELELLETVVDVLGEVSYDDLSMDLVAARARCSKATLYRLWPTKPQLVVAALYLTRPITSEAIDTGTLRGDMLAMAGVLASNAEKITALVASLGHALLTDEDLVKALHTSMVEPWFADLGGFVDRAVERGELSSRPFAADFLPDLLLSVTITRPLFQGRVIDIDYLTRCVDQVLLPAVLAGV